MFLEQVDFLSFLVTPHGIWDLSSLIRDQTLTLCIGSMESLPLNHQGSPKLVLFLVAHSGQLQT